MPSIGGIWKQASIMATFGGYSLSIAPVRPTGPPLLRRSASLFPYQDAMHSMFDKLQIGAAKIGFWQIRCPVRRNGTARLRHDPGSLSKHPDWQGLESIKLNNPN